MKEKAVVSNAQMTKPKHTFLLHLLTGCLIFYGLMVNTNPSNQQHVDIKNTEGFFIETVDFVESERFTETIVGKNPFFEIKIPAPYTGYTSKNVMKNESITSKN